MFKLTKLNNGLKILSQKVNNCSTVTLGYVVKCGSYNEDESNLGIAHFTEHMLFKGTYNRSKEDINYDIESVGGVLNAYTSFDHTKYWCTIPSMHIETGIDVLSDLIWNNTIPKNEFDKERNVILEELKMYNDDAMSRLSDLCFKTIFRDYTNRQLVGGTLDSVKGITREQMINFIDKYYTSNNIILIATGDVEHSNLCNLVKKYIVDIESSSYDTKPASFEGFKEDIERNVEVLDNTITQSHLKWALHTIEGKINDKQMAISEIIATILGGNSSSRLYNIIREQRGLAYTVTVDNDVVYDFSGLYGYVGLDKENINDVKNIVINELNKFKKNKVSDKDLKAAKEYLKGSLLISLESTRGKNSFLCSSVVYGFNFDYNSYINVIDSITSEDIYEFAKKYIDTDKIFFISLISKDN